MKRGDFYGKRKAIIGPLALTAKENFSPVSRCRECVDISLSPACFSTNFVVFIGVNIILIIDFIALTASAGF